MARRQHRHLSVVRVSTRITRVNRLENSCCSDDNKRMNDLKQLDNDYSDELLLKLNQLEAEIETRSRQLNFFYVIERNGLSLLNLGGFGQLRRV